MFDVRLLLVWRPGDREDIKPGGMSEKPISLQKNQGQLSESSLFEQINGFRRSTGVFAFRGPNFHENQALTIESDEIQFAARA